MESDIFKFWARINKADKIHPDDKEVLERVQHGFDLRCLPGPFFGPLQTAKVVFLYLSPGFVPEDVTDAECEHVQNLYAKQRTGTAQIPGPDDYPAAWNWWHAHVNVFGELEDMRDKIAFLNIGAYKSEAFNDHPLLASLPSCRVSIDWAQANLFPEAMEGRRIVICMRSHRYWGLKRGEAYGKSLYAPETTPAGHMHHGPLYDEIIEKVQERLDA